VRLSVLESAVQQVGFDESGYRVGYLTSVCTSLSYLVVTGMFLCRGFMNYNDIGLGWFANLKVG
jgi:hypothetical protein